MSRMEKTWNQLTVMQKHRLANDDPAAYARLRAAHLARSPRQRQTPALHLGKRWAELTTMEKHRLGHSDRPLYERLRADHLADQQERAQLIERGQRELKLTGKTAAHFRTRPVEEVRGYLDVATPFTPPDRGSAA